MFILGISETREHAAATGGDTGRWEQAGAVSCVTLLSIHRAFTSHHLIRDNSVCCIVVLVFFKKELDNRYLQFIRD